MKNPAILKVPKPCWELNYCPYGPLVEDFPALPPTRADAIKHQEFLKEQMKRGAYKGKKKFLIQRMIKQFDPKNYPITIDPEIREKTCNIFGHICPVFFVSEAFTETFTPRRASRSMPRDVMIRVVRRDNYICQICGKHLLETEMEFDHIIPLSKGGTSEESNLRLTCKDCNRSKGSKADFELSYEDL